MAAGDSPARKLARTLAGESPAPHRQNHPLLNWPPASPIVKLRRWTSLGMDHKGRQQRLQKCSRPASPGCAAGHSSSQRSLSLRIHRQRRVLLVTEAKSVFFTDGRYTTQARAEVQGGADRDRVARLRWQRPPNGWPAQQERRLDVTHPPRFALRLGIESDRISWRPAPGWPVFCLQVSACARLRLWWSRPAW